jgi:hypothetical protein
MKHSETKSPDGHRRGRLRGSYEITASSIRRRGKETIIPVGAEDLGSLLGGEAFYYVPDDPTACESAIEVLRALPPDTHEDVAKRLEITPRHLRNIFKKHVVPRSNLRARVTTLAEAVQRSGNILPPDHTSILQSGVPTDGVERALQALRGRGFSVREIACMMHVSERTAWRWFAHGSCPRERVRQQLYDAMAR